MVEFCGGSSVVECLLPKEKVAGSSPVRRSGTGQGSSMVEQCFRKAEVEGSIPSSGS